MGRLSETENFRKLPKKKGGCTGNRAIVIACKMCQVCRQESKETPDYYKTADAIQISKS
ncbi:MULTISPECIES: hypothetical protein [Bacillus]|uniref:hypothetical protein n=1 Tax=Bacillus TaxID=1386 RepID=UPI0012B6AB75|nr:MULTISPECIES: hypothetical protein [Bacillus]